MLWRNHAVSGSPHTLLMTGGVAKKFDLFAAALEQFSRACLIEGKSIQQPAADRRGRAFA